jgi:UDP-glucose 4-epimerase
MQAGAKKLLYTSSAAVYGEPATIPTGEAEALDPRSPYALSKHTVERYLEYFSHSVGLASVVVRPANVYGPRAGTAGEGGVVSVFARSLTTGTPLTIHGHGDQTRDYIYVTDVAQGMLKAIEQGNGAYNLGTGHDISIRELVVRFGEVVGTVPRVDYAAARPHDIKRSALSPRRAERELGWKSQVPLTEGLRLTLKWFKDNPKYL